MKSTVIIPAYKPDEALIKITDALWSIGCRIIVVDDGSGEEYLPVFDRVSDVCLILRHPENRGKGAAIKTALTCLWDDPHVSGPIGIMDCDGQHLPEDMLRLLRFSGEHPDSLALGVRSVSSRMPLKSRLGNLITRGVFRLVSGVKVSDTQTGLRAFDAGLIERLLTVDGDRYEYETNMLLLCAREGIPIREMPIHTIYLDRANSNSHFHALRDSVRIYKNIFKFTLSSLSSFVLDYLLFSALMLVFPHTGSCIFLSNVTARAVSAFYNYSMNCRFVFHTSRQAETAVHYFVLAAFILTANNAVLAALTQGLHVPVYGAKLMTECLLFCLSWLIQNFVIFQKGKDSRTENRQIAL
ncbi:MAG: bifunctional glycosyltransferase family 2/GtrA family protein [Eubacteriales bacterium]|nr:bifunctional glycosyltransferase family 2/GtrA family protein [Eubacteriales bacterium]